MGASTSKKQQQPNTQLGPNLSELGLESNVQTRNRRTNVVRDKIASVLFLRGGAKKKNQEQVAVPDPTKQPPLAEPKKSFAPQDASTLHLGYAVDWSKKGELGSGHYATV
jgi:hypothetical protein